MALRNDEPDIIVGGEPSAPPIATAVSAPPIATAVPAFNNDPNKNIERTTNADGSLIVKCTTTSRQSNGYRDVTIEYFYVPANMAQTVIMSMDATGDPPSSLYMTKMEQQVLPPGTSEVISHAPSAAATAAAGGATVAGGGGHNPVPQTYTTEQVVGSSGSNRGAIIGFCVCVGVAIIISIIASAIRTNEIINNWPTPAPYPYYWPPTPAPRTQNPTREGCKDTPNWVDGLGKGCDWYAKSSNTHNYNDVCTFSVVGDMGRPSKNCCVCGGGSTWMPPTLKPTPAPITPNPTKANCKDTPDWEDLLFGCDHHAESPDQCRYSYLYSWDMGSATENCCACGGGTVPSSLNKLTSAADIPTAVSREEEMMNEMGSNLSRTNPFRSPTAAKED